MTVAYHPEYARLPYNEKGANKPVGTDAALFLSQLVYWTPRGHDADGWIYKKQSEWEEETGLTRIQQETCRRRLMSAGLLEEARRGEHGVLHFRLTAFFWECGKPTNANVENPHSEPASMWKTDKRECGKPTNANVENPHSLIGTRPAESETTNRDYTQREHTHTQQGTKAQASSVRVDSVQAQNTSLPKTPVATSKPTRKDLDPEEGWRSQAALYGAALVTKHRLRVEAKLRAGEIIPNPYGWVQSACEGEIASQQVKAQAGGARASPAVPTEPSAEELAQKAADKAAQLAEGNAAAQKALARRKAREHGTFGDGNTTHGGT